jgi:isopentenyldiphosphate isomerase
MTSGYLRHILDLNQWHPGNFSDLRIDGERVGRLKQPMVEALGQWPQLFTIEPDAIHLNPQIQGFDQRSRVLAEVNAELLAQGVISHLHGEPYPVTHAGREHAFATIDRAAAPYWGLRAYGQHLNGFVRTDDGIKFWIARRSADRVNFPNRLDNMVAGGLPQNLGLRENLLKECREEASVPEDLASKAIPVGALTYCRETKHGLKPDTLYCYDLELPADFVPSNSDGEVAEFMLLPVQEVARIVRETDEFKLNCNLVIIDFLIRQGQLEPEHPEYLAIIEGLHEKL